MSMLDQITRLANGPGSLDDKKRIIQAIARADARQRRIDRAVWGTVIAVNVMLFAVIFVSIAYQMLQGSTP